MPALPWMLLLGTALAGSPAEARPASAAKTDDTTLRGGGPTQKKKKKKSGKKKGKKKQQSQGAISPWGASKLYVDLGVGLPWGITREAPETGEEATDDGGSSAQSCTGDDCTTADSDTNAATGWGPGRVGATVALVKLGKRPAVFGPSLRWSRTALKLDGLRHHRLDDADTASLGATYVADRADYRMQLQSVTGGMLFASRFHRKTAWFLLFQLDAGYAWGTVETTLDSAPRAPHTGTVGGFALGVDVAVGYAFTRHTHLIVDPLAVQFMDLRADDRRSFPFLTDGDAMTTTLSPSLRLALTF